MMQACYLPGMLIGAGGWFLSRNRFAWNVAIRSLRPPCSQIKDRSFVPLLYLNIIQVTILLKEHEMNEIRVHIAARGRIFLLKHTQRSRGGLFPAAFIESELF